MFNLENGKQVTVKYSCGHGSHEIDVKGIDPKDDASRIYWFEHNICCPECFEKFKKGKKKTYTDDILEPTVNCTYESEKNYSYLKFTATGKLNTNKDKLKSIGFRWDKAKEIDEKTNTEYEKWVMIYTFKIFSIEEMQEFLSQFRPLIEGIGYKLYTDMIELPVSKIQEDIAEHSKLYNGCYDFMKKRHGLLAFSSWNGKIYGGTNNRTYYINNTKYSMTEEEMNNIIDFENNL